MTVNSAAIAVALRHTRADLAEFDGMAPPPPMPPGALWRVTTTTMRTTMTTAVPSCYLTNGATCVTDGVNDNNQKDDRAHDDWRQR